MSLQGDRVQSAVSQEPGVRVGGAAIPGQISGVRVRRCETEQHRAHFCAA